MRKKLLFFCSLLIASAAALSLSAAPVSALRKAAGTEGAGPEAGNRLATTITQAGSTLPFQCEMERRGSKPLNYVLGRKAQGGAPLQMRADGVNLPDIYGYVIHTDDQANLGGYKDGFFLTPHNGGEAFKFMGNGMAGNDITVWGGVLVGDIYYVSFWWPIMAGVDFCSTFAFDMTNPGPWNPTNFDIKKIENIASTQTYCPVDGKIYGITLTNQALGVQFSSMEYGDKSVTVTKIADLPGNYKNYEGLASDAQGNLYCIVRDIDTSGDTDVVTDSRLVKIDRATGAVTTIGSTGLIPPYRGDATIDLATGKMYWAVSTAEKGSMAEVNLSTGAATVLFDYQGNEEVIGLAVKAAQAGLQAPGKPYNLYAEFGLKDLTGTISFRTPDAFFDGTPATDEELTYHILVNGQEVKTGTSVFNSSVSESVTVSEPGDYRFSVYCSNDAGDGKEVSTYEFVGPGLPGKPSALSASYIGGDKIFVEWFRNNSSEDNGYIDVNAIRYNLSRRVNGGDEEVLATEIAETEFTDNVTATETPATYEYIVRQTADGRTGASSTSEKIIRKLIAPPYENGFDSADDINSMGLRKGNEYHYWMWNSQYRYAYIEDSNGRGKNDWLISPGLYLEAGYIYEFSMDAWAEGPNYPETFEVKCGMTDTPEGLTETVLEPTGVKATESSPATLTGKFTAGKTGYYYFGIHALSDGNGWNCYIDNIKLSAGLQTSVPGLSTDLKVVPASDGELSAEISFKTPAVSASGSSLKSISKVEVLRGDEVIRTFDSAEPGQVLTCTDASPVNGMNTYSVIAYNEVGAGASASVEAYVGVYAPVAVGEVTLVETGNDGEVTVSWPAVEKDVEGRDLKPSQVTYSVYRFDGQNEIPAGENISGLSYTFRYLPADEQALAMVRVYAVTAAGRSEKKTSDMIPVGKPYDGIKESFRNGHISYDWGVNTGGGGQWALMTEESGADPYDGDNGFIAFYGTAEDIWGDFFSGKISLRNISEPALTLRVYPITSSQTNNNGNIIEVAVREIGGEYTTLYSKALTELGTDVKWYRVVVPLDAYAGKMIQFKLRGVSKTHNYTLVDDLNVLSVKANDAALAGFSVPAKVRPAREYFVTVDVDNPGRNSLSDVKVELFRDGALEETQTISAVEAGDRVDVSFPQTLHALKEESVTYSARIIAEGDADLSNNDSKTVTAELSLSNLPYVNDLRGEGSDGDVRLSWTRPSASAGVPEEVFESFEQGEPFAHEYEGWKFVDADQGRVGGFDGTDIPGMTTGVSKSSFFVFDNTTEGFNTSSFAAHSGSCFLAAIYNNDGTICDDWAISPLLTGQEQKVSFYAKNYSLNYHEIFEVLVSLKTDAIEDFVPVPEIESYTLYEGLWKEFYFTVPAGTKYFAVRYHSRNAFMIMLDDFTFTPAITEESLTLKGYNVYRDGVKLNDEEVAEPEYADPTVYSEPATTKYRVTAVYAQGESKGSNEVSIEQTSIEDVRAGLSISTAPGLIIVENAGDRQIHVYNVDGMEIYSGYDSAIPVSPAVYVVKVSETVAKVFVR